MRQSSRAREMRSLAARVGTIVWLLASSVAAQTDGEPPTVDDPASNPPQDAMSLGYDATPNAASSSNEPDIFQLVPDPFLQDEVRRQLKNQKYRFCQDPNYRFFRAEKESLCPHVSAFESTCPMLERACSRPPWEEEMAQNEPEESDWSFPSFNLSWVDILFKALFWGALGLGVFYIVRALVRRAQLWKEERDLDVGASSPLPNPRTDRMPDELRTHVLLKMAREKLDQSEITEALHLTYRATIRALADADWVKPHRSKTSGDYLRSLASDRVASPSNTADQQDKQIEVSAVTGHLLDLDRERFRSGPRAEQARTLLGQAESLARRLSPLVLLLGCFWFIGCSTFVPQEFPYQPYAPRGSQLFEDLLRRQAGSVHRRLHRVVDVPEETSTVIAIDAALRPIEWQTLSRWASSGGHLVVAAPSAGFWEEFGQEFEPTACSGPLTTPPLTIVPVDDTMAFAESTSGQVLARCADRIFASSMQWDAGWVTVIADAQLFQNASLAARHNATVAFHLVGNLDGHVEYLGPWTGRGSQNPLESITRAGFGWWVLHLLLLGIIHAWSRGKRMTTPIDPRDSSRRAFTEHARALSGKYERARASGWALRHYAEWVYDTLRRRAPSTRADLKSLTRAVSTSEIEANKLREALTTARRADELGETTKEHYATFRRLKSAILGISEVSRKSRIENRERLERWNFKNSAKNTSAPSAKCPAWCWDRKPSSNTR